MDPPVLGGRPDPVALNVGGGEGHVFFDTEPEVIADMGDHELWMAFFKDSEENQIALMCELTKAPP